ncbi:unnamed protein product [Didymodactylos carnosus]|uniref:Uncharacterized protein n=1 Tax=Didymodactylos carnosus TaxID=1234261 RepID=A0A815SN07_9BILA|nr:unnamed protein product [Didymodactylos carnosus]CAF4356793.1 unnamed protein product [Didymodactylos carnosus]
MPDKTIKSSSIKQLFQRINYQRHRHQLSNRYDSFKYLFMMLITTILIAILLKCHTVVYNYLFGPFHMNIEQFQEYLKLYKTRNYSWTYSLFREDLIQIELGENQLENRNYREQYYFNKLISSYKMVKQIKIKSTLYPNNLYVRLPAKHNFYFNKKIPYKFHKFSIKTLRCIVKNLNSYEYQSWLEKSDYIKFINEKYLNNSFEFNELVITKCGIYIGYLYSSSSYTYYADDIVLNSSEPYLTEVLFYLILFGCSIILWLLLISLFYLCSYLFTLQIIKFKINLHHDVLEYFHLLSVDHLKSFEELLFYHSSNIHESQQLFILDNYIVLFKLNTKELNFYILQRYVDQSPFCLIKINSVTWINTDGIYYKHNESTRLIRWPGQSYHQWLHQKLIETNLNYKQTYVNIHFF